MKNFYLFKLALIAVIALATIVTFFTSCSKDDEDDNTTESSKETIFSLDFTLRASDATPSIYAYFGASKADILPSVIINGEEVTQYEFDGNLVFANLEIPYSKSINYSVSADGKTTTGSITMPDTITNNLTCNDQIVNSCREYQLPQAETCIFKWAPVECDYQGISFNEKGRNPVYIDNTDSSYVINKTDYQYDRISIYITPINGCRMIPGASPNVTGAYGKGYVNARSQISSDAYSYVYFKTKSDKEKLEIIEEQRHQKFADNFKMFLDK